jgi:hypothetical protein
MGASGIEQWLRGMVEELRHHPAGDDWVCRFPWTLSQHLESAADEIKRLREATGQNPRFAMLSPGLILPRSPRHGFLASTTERHAGGRNMGRMGHRATDAP